MSTHKTHLTCYLKLWYLKFLLNSNNVRHCFSFTTCSLAFNSFYLNQLLSQLKKSSPLEFDKKRVWDKESWLCGEIRKYPIRALHLHKVYICLMWHTYWLMLSFVSRALNSWLSYPCTGNGEDPDQPVHLAVWWGLVASQIYFTIPWQQWIWPYIVLHSCKLIWLNMVHDYVRFSYGLPHICKNNSFFLNSFYSTIILNCRYITKVIPNIFKVS